MSLIRKPEIFVIGAPKCGTTALCYYLSQHPDICFSDPKEPSYFCSDFPGYATVGSIAEYLETYFGRCRGQASMLGEGSATYLYSNVAVANILEFNPGARFIVMLRSPVDMIHALHSQFVYDGTEDVRDFEAAWGLQSKRRAGNNIPVGCIEPAFLQYREVGRLGAQIDRLFETAQKDRCLLLTIDDLASEPETVYSGVLEFLGLNHDGRRDFRRLNENKEHHLHALGVGMAWIRDNPPLVIRKIPGTRRAGRMLMRMNSRRTKRQPLRPEFRRQLVECFSDDIVKLEEHLHRDLEHWREVR